MMLQTSKEDYVRRNATDEELIRLFLKTQDNRHFEELYRRYSDRVYSKCLYIIKDAGKAEDLTHDIFLKLICKLSTFKENSKFSTWLYSVTYNHCMDQLRSIKKRPEIIHDPAVDIPDDLDLIRMFDADDVQECNLRKALNKLTIDEKGLLFMKYMDNLSIRDIAGIYEVTESAVKMRLLRSREKLRVKYMETIFLAWTYAVIVSGIF